MTLCLIVEWDGFVKEGVLRKEAVWGVFQGLKFVRTIYGPTVYVEDVSRFCLVLYAICWRGVSRDV